MFLLCPLIPRQVKEDEIKLKNKFLQENNEKNEEVGVQGSEPLCLPFSQNKGTYLLPSSHFVSSLTLLSSYNTKNKNKQNLIIKKNHVFHFMGFYISRFHLYSCSIHSLYLLFCANGFADGKFSHKNRMATVNQLPDLMSYLF